MSKKINNSQWIAARKTLPPMESEAVRNWFGDLDPMVPVKLLDITYAANSVPSCTGTMLPDEKGGFYIDIPLDPRSYIADRWLNSIMLEHGEALESRGICIDHDERGKLVMGLTSEAGGLCQSDQKYFFEWVRRAKKAIDVFFDANDLMWEMG
ncbi:hypothetical protein [Pseudorhodoplanes sp.]|uniref:hypothetical protein n=1 Tax=Pseudorhodoplanes sp. TaxID=1934341 RepID=UPI003D144F22